MKRSALLILSVATGLFTLSCNRTKTGGGPPKFADCDQDVEVTWAGKDVCAQEHDPNHWSSTTTAVKIVPKKCKGIHITHTKDFRLDLLLYKENNSKSCPLQPFKTTFPVQSGKNHERDFRTDLVKDPASDGCQYELQLTELDDPQTCDPHVEIDGTP